MFGHRTRLAEVIRLHLREETRVGEYANPIFAGTATRRRFTRTTILRRSTMAQTITSSTEGPPSTDGSVCHVPAARVRSLCMPRKSGCQHASGIAGCLVTKRALEIRRIQFRVEEQIRTHVRKHGLLAGKHCKGAVLDEEDEVRALPVAPLRGRDGLGRVRPTTRAVHAEFDRHAAGLKRRETVSHASRGRNGNCTHVADICPCALKRKSPRISTCKEWGSGGTEHSHCLHSRDRTRGTRMLGRPRPSATGGRMPMG